MSVKINKNGNEYPLGVIPQHYPADRVYLDGDTSKTVDDALDNKVSDNPTFTEAQTRTNIASGETFATMLGKIKKWFTDLPNMFVSKSDGGTFGGNVTIDTKSGTTSTPGYSRFYLGNNKGVGTDKNSVGLIGLYAQSGKLVEIYDRNGDISDYRYLALPNKSGTLALLSDISGGGGVTKDLLYTNPDPLSAFTAKTMNFQGLSAYDMVEIVFRVDTGSTEYSSQFFDNSISYIQSANYHYVMTSSNFMAYQRRFTFNSDSIVFQGGYRIAFNTTNPKTTYGAAYDKGMFPYKIFGWKFG